MKKYIHLTSSKKHTTVVNNIYKGLKYSVNNLRNYCDYIIYVDEYGCIAMFDTKLLYFYVPPDFWTIKYFQNNMLEMKAIEALFEEHDIRLYFNNDLYSLLEEK